MSPRMSKYELSRWGELPAELRDGLTRVAERVQFPVNSKAELAEQLGGANAPFMLRGQTEVSVGFWVHILPAQLFPIATDENFREKVAEFYAAPARPETSADELGEMIARMVRENSAALEPLLRTARETVQGVSTSRG